MKRIGPIAVAMFLAAPAAAQAPSSDAPAHRFHPSLIAFTIPEKDLLPENVAYDPVTDAFFVGSTRKGKIMRRTADGAVREFVAPSRELWMVVGMKVDADRRHLWVASSGGGNLEGYERTHGRPAGVFQFHLDTGQILGKWTLDRHGETHFFNDLVLTPKGDVFITHMIEEPAVFVIRGGRGPLKKLGLAYDAFTMPNGITTAPGGALYVAHREGISRFDASTGERRPLATAQRIDLSGIDGLYWYRDALIAIHPARQEVWRYALSGDGRSIVAAQLLEANHPLHDRPTTGVIVRDSLFYIANSQFGKVRDGRLPPAAELVEPAVLKLRLDHR